MNVPGPLPLPAVMYAAGQSGRYAGVGDGDGDGDGDAVGDAVGEGDGVGVEVGVGVAGAGVFGTGVGVGVTGLTDGVGDADPDGCALGVALAVGCTGTDELVAVPPEPLQPTTTASRTIVTNGTRRIAGTSDGRRLKRTSPAPQGRSPAAARTVEKPPLFWSAPATRREGAAVGRLA